VIRGLTVVLFLSTAPARPNGRPARDSRGGGGRLRAEIGIALLDLGTGDSLWLQAHWRVHAASTMKIPGWNWPTGGHWRPRLDKPTRRRNGFRSVLDVALRAEPSDDSTAPCISASETRLRCRAGPAHDRAGSNLATNLLIDLLDPVRINERARALGPIRSGAPWRRGPEAFDAGIINRRPRATWPSCSGLADGTSATRASTEIMLEILSAQEFAGIPAGS
jgi:hypothetical protein